MLTTLADCREYDFYQYLEYYMDEPKRNDGPLEPYISEFNETCENYADNFINTIMRTNNHNHSTKNEIDLH